MVVGVSYFPEERLRSVAVVLPSVPLAEASELLPGVLDELVSVPIELPLVLLPEVVPPLILPVLPVPAELPVPPAASLLVLLLLALPVLDGEGEVALGDVEGDVDEEEDEVDGEVEGDVDDGVDGGIRSAFLSHAARDAASAPAMNNDASGFI